MPFFAKPHPSRNLLNRIHWGQLVSTPLDIGTWALLQPASTQNHAPQLCWINPETLACVWMAGGQEGTSTMSIYGSVLKQGQTKWSAPKLLSSNKDCSEQNPLLFTTNDGRIHLVHTAQTARDPMDNTWLEQGSTFSMQWTAKLFHQSTKGWGSKWTAAREFLPEPAFCRNPPIVTDTGDLLLPIYKSLEAGGGFGHDHSLVQPLGQDGKALGASFSVPLSKGRVQGSIVQTADGSGLLQFFRSRLADKVYVSRSDLEGKRWSEPIATSLPNNNSSIQALRLQSRKLAIIFNRFGVERDASFEPQWGDSEWPRARWPLSIAISEDDGLSFPWIRDIEAGYGFCGAANWHLNGQLAYPSILEGPPGIIHTAYSWGSRMAIKYSSFNLNEITG